jgi:hypothetical protein
MLPDADPSRANGLMLDHFRYDNKRARIRGHAALHHDPRVCRLLHRYHYPRRTRRIGKWRKLISVRPRPICSEPVGFARFPIHSRRRR